LGWLAGKQASRECDCGRHGQAQLAIEAANQHDMINAIERDSSGNALPRSFDSWNAKVREEVIDPFQIGVSRMSSNFSVIESRHIILKDQDISLNGSLR
jgi:hypothetical protein